jgi:uncharacterized protein YjiS (DUF1127 family)
MQMSHILLRRSIDLCDAARYMNIRQGEETLEQVIASEKEARRLKMETEMAFSFLRRYLRARNVYWNVVRELSCYTDRELHDIGIDRADIRDIAETAAQQA